MSTECYPALYGPLAGKSYFACEQQRQGSACAFSQSDARFSRYKQTRTQVGGAGDAGWSGDSEEYLTMDETICVYRLLLVYDAEDFTSMR